MQHVANLLKFRKELHQSLKSFLKTLNPKLPQKLPTGPIYNLSTNIEKNQRKALDV